MMHLNPDDPVVGHDDGLAEWDRPVFAKPHDGGGSYGPYLVPKWFKSPAPNMYEIVYTLSSWNPYQAHLMRTVLTPPGSSVPPPIRGVGLPKASLNNGDWSQGPLAGWQAQGDVFAVFQKNGRNWITTFVPGKGDLTRGTLSQSVPIDSTTTKMKFFIHGGHASVKLLHNGEVVREVRGRDDNNVDRPVVFYLRNYQGETVTLMIEDQRTDPWGFISVSPIEFE
jgi:hypothetical protein